MKRLGLLLLCVYCFSGAVSKKRTLTLKKGTYSVCANYTQVSLKINSDSTFFYVDRTGRSPLTLNGTWALSGNRIVLKNFPKEIKIFDQWKIDEGCDCITSRKALEWRRLCLVTPE